MENLGVEELTQLVTYYRQRSNDLEFQMLQVQLKLNSLILEKQNAAQAAEKPSKSKSE